MVRVGFPQYVCHRELIWDKAPCRFQVEYVARSKVPWRVAMRLFRRDGAPFFINSVTGATPEVAIGKMLQYLGDDAGKENINSLLEEMLKESQGFRSAEGA